MAPRSLFGKSEILGLVTDAQGVYHDLSKGSFDAFSIKHPGVVKHLSTALLDQPLVKGIQQLAADSGVDISKYDKVDISALAKLAGKVGAIGAGSEGILGSAATALGITLESIPTGGLAALGIAVEAAIEWAVGKFHDDEPHDTNFNKGDWLAIDMGSKTVRSLDNEIELGMSEFLQDAPDLSEMDVLARVEDIHYGFYVSRGKEEASVTVFDMMTNTTVEHYIFEVRKLPEENRTRLDNDAFASKVRELYFTKTDNVRMECEVSCAPGTEVLWKGKLFHIVSCDGDIGLIEADDGSRDLVPMVGLQRSRQERAGFTVWRYEKGEAPIADGFVHGLGGFGTGDWVWVQRDAAFELAMCHIISGKNAVVYMTQSGFRLAVPVDEVHAAERDFSDLYNRVTEFVQFKLAAIEGRAHDTRRLRLPSKYRDIIRQISPRFRVDPKPLGVDQLQFAPSKPSRPVENQDATRMLDDAEELQNLLGVNNNVKQEWGAEEEDCRRRLARDGQGGDLCRTNGSSPEEPTRRGPTVITFDPSAGAIFGAVGVAALAWYFWLR